MQNLFCEFSCNVYFCCFSVLFVTTSGNIQAQQDSCTK